MLYLYATISKTLSNRFDYGHKLRACKTHDIKISLPTYHNEKIAFDYMVTFIVAIKKQAIKDLVLWSEKKTTNQ